MEEKHERMFERIIVVLEEQLEINKITWKLYQQAKKTKMEYFLIWYLTGAWMAITINLLLKLLLLWKN